ncbi:type IV pilus modification protein PilV [Noviherbaspirillum denitrificans]|uniref:Type IV pilus modification protein PilV n=1 Tax=Noviherbaspirillum denitrificans TaxID=1968433 RepID=A0A254TIL4_9BURK|nr:type IV pilus modification protein PilV [Noviherbaspirillum denitrificans]OWW22471.1 hypothetical protein AYR66_26200 [Noviherbaspirillum denitrificans]
MNREAGYSMTEVLVSILLLSTGVLGTAALQAAATRTTQQSAYQTTALQLAADVADTVQVMASDERYLHLAAAVFDIDFTSSPDERFAPSASCHFAMCAPAEFANAELDEWKTRLAANFPSARLRICHDDSPWEEAGHAHTWECSGAGAGPLVVKVGWKAKSPDGSYADEGRSFPPSVVVPVAPV